MHDFYLYRNDLLQYRLFLSGFVGAIETLVRQTNAARRTVHKGQVVMDSVYVPLRLHTGTHAAGTVFQAYGLRDHSKAPGALV